MLIFHTGSVLYPENDGLKFIIHICNTTGKWGGGFTKSLNQRWLKPKNEYLALTSRFLGDIQIIHVEPEICVINMIAQVSHWKNGPPIRYSALEQTLSKVSRLAADMEASVHMPRIGTGLAGGNWEVILPIVMKYLVSKGIEVHVYDLQL
jgi:O-acetyl-ADP-ribose deacetylase (regulator of RNase III)